MSFSLNTDINNNLKIFLDTLEKLFTTIDKCINFVYTYGVGDDYVEIKLQKWGNSLGIRIPSNILKSLNLKTNDTIDIKEEDGKIIITKIEKKNFSLEQRIKEYEGKNLSKEFEWDEPQGREIW